MFYHLLWQKCLYTYTLIYTIYLHCNTASILIQLVCVSNVKSRCLGTFLGVLIITIITTNVNITGTDWNLNIGRAVTFPEFQYPNLNSQDGRCRGQKKQTVNWLNTFEQTPGNLGWTELVCFGIWTDLISNQCCNIQRQLTIVELLTMMMTNVYCWKS